MALLERFYPDIYVKSVFEMPLDDMKKLGIRALVLISTTQWRLLMWQNPIRRSWNFLHI